MLLGEASANARAAPGWRSKLRVATAPTALSATRFDQPRFADLASAPDHERTTVRLGDPRLRIVESASLCTHEGDDTIAVCVKSHDKYWGH